MQIVVIGAGNIGCVYGGNLARIGESVAFFDIWPEHVDRIAAHGLRVEGATGDFTVKVPASVRASELPKADLAIVCVNSYATASAAASAKALLKDGGYCLTLQNGMGNVEILANALGEDRVLAGLSFQSGDLRGPGLVHHTNNGPTYIGELHGKQTDRLEHLNGILSKAGMVPVLVENIVATIWSKFVYNCGINAICAITGLRPGQIREVPALDEFQSRIVDETLALLRAKGIVLPDEHLPEAIRQYCSQKFHRPSMLQHLDRERRTEIDSLNGYVARESASYGLDAPYNQALTMLMKGREFLPKLS